MHAPIATISKRLRGSRLLTSPIEYTYRRRNGEPLASIRLATPYATSDAPPKAVMRTENGPDSAARRRPAYAVYVHTGRTWRRGSAGTKQAAKRANWINHCAFVIVPKMSPAVGARKNDMNTMASPK